ncbi:hypothetical protein CCM_06168 [Cordyceps militaris CM01]|uniref:Uncharacterized protein n=1 Tax=Cordyceps militaris (strain CM01) TaxID=983644 RepID=G3JJ66_CORMM|nr:uncharacterized protein CCM_06168 [Cordyceps militaris CM01]EGX92008.1 hypothetical protein CCM_06168 [Cordyceps militaris CM01]
MKGCYVRGKFNSSMPLLSLFMPSSLVVPVILSVPFITLLRLDYCGSRTQAMKAQRDIQLTYLSAL